MLKLKSMSAAAFVLLGSVAFAQQGAPSDSTDSGLTRASVVAELLRAKASGDIPSWREGSIDGSASTASMGATGAQGRSFTAPGRSRTEVQAELATARASGELARLRSLDIHGGY